MLKNIQSSAIFNNFLKSVLNYFENFVTITFRIDVFLKGSDVIIHSAWFISLLVAILRINPRICRVLLT